MQAFYSARKGVLRNFTKLTNNCTKVAFLIKLQSAIFLNKILCHRCLGSFKKYVTARGWGRGIGLFCDKSLRKFWGVGGSHLYSGT